MILLIVVSLVVFIISQAVGSIQTSKAQATFAELSVAQLQAAAPKWDAVLRLSSDTLFGNKSVAWFEELALGTYAESDNLDNYRFLEQQYVGMLEALSGFLAFSKIDWGKEYDPSQARRITDPPFPEIRPLHETLKWMHKVARYHNGRLRGKGIPACKWNEIILQSSYTEEPTSYAGSAFMAQNQRVLTTAVNPKALTEEIARVRASESAPAAPARA